MIFVEFEKIQKILSNQLGMEVENIQPESTFVEDLGVDSLEMAELAMALEEEFDIRMEDDAMEGITTVEDLVELIKAKVGSEE
jgi:acyl carrier protein